MTDGSDFFTNFVTVKQARFSVRGREDLTPVHVTVDGVEHDAG